VDTGGIFNEWRRLSASGVNNRAAAAALGVSEAALLATGSGILCTRLACDAQTFLERAQALGPAKYVVRNDYAVLERSGEVRSVTCSGDGLVAESSSFQLRLAGRAGCAFALEEPCADGSVKRSLQLFDPAGVTLVKIVFRSDACSAAFGLLADELRHETQAAPASRLSEEPLPTSAAASMPLRGDVLASFLRRAADLAHPLCIRVGNAGATLQCTTAIQRVKRSSRAPWINVLDPTLDLHLYEARIRHVTGEQDPATQTRTLHWSADDGTLALSTSVTEAFAAWVLSTNGLREPALPA
jgi:putative hemin transport protein